MIPEKIHCGRQLNPPFPVGLTLPPLLVVKFPPVTFTLGESIVLFTAICGVSAVLRSNKKGKVNNKYE